MVKYVLYVNKNINSLIVNRVSTNRTKNRTINSIQEFNQIVAKFVSQDFSVTIDGENMILSSNNVTFEIQGYKEYIDCSYLSVLKRKINEVQAKKGVVVKLNKEEVHKRAEESKKPRFRKVAASIVATLAVVYMLSGTTNTLDVFDRSSEVIPNKPTYEASIKEEPKNKEIESDVMSSSAVYYSSTPSENVEDDKVVETPEPEEVEPEVQEKNIEPEVHEETREEKYDNLIRTYSNYFLMDADKVIKLARDLTDNYTIDFSEVSDNTSYRLENMEAQVMVFCHELNRDNLVFPLSDLGFTVEDFKSGAERVTLSTQVEAMGYTIEEFQAANKPNHLHENFVLSGGYSYSEFVGKVCDLLDMDKNYALAISYLESGSVGSDIALNKNNFGGLRGKDGFFTYDTPEAGVIAFLRNLKRYERFDFTSIEELSGKYVNGDPSVPAPTWIKNVEGFHYQISSEPERYFLDKDETLALGEEQVSEREKTLTLTETY